MHVHVGDSAGEAVGDFALEVQAGLVHARRDEIGREGGDIGAEVAGRRVRAARKTWISSGSSASGVGICGENLVIVVFVLSRNRFAESVRCRWRWWKCRSAECACRRARIRRESPADARFRSSRRVRRAARHCGLDTDLAGHRPERIADEILRREVCRS